MNAKEVLATIGYEGFVKSLFNRSGDLSKDFTHAILGVITECHELLNAKDAVNALEEAGDLAFYMEALCQVLNDYSPLTTHGQEFIQFYKDALHHQVKDSPNWNFEDTTVEWLDLAKRWIGYGKAPTMSTTQLFAEASAMATLVVESSSFKDFDVSKLILGNVEKLLKRYNGLRFDAERAVNRDLDAERAALEKV